MNALAPRLPRWIGLVVALLLVVGNAAYVAAHLGFLHERTVVLETDHYHYIAMAKGQDNLKTDPRAHVPPFCYRLLVPWLAHELSRTGLRLDTSFYLLSQTFLFLFLSALFEYLRSVGFPPLEAATGVVLAGLLQGAVRWYSYQYWMTDPAALFLITLAFLLIQQGRHTALVAVTTLAVLVRETSFLILPYFLLREWKREGPRVAVGRSLQLAIAPVVAFLLVRYYVLAVVDPKTGEMLVETIRARWDRLFDNQLYFMTIGSLGVVIPLLLMSPRRTFRHFKGDPAAAAVVLMAYASLALASNTDRLLAYALPALLPFCLLQLRTLAEATRLTWTSVAILAIIPQAVLFVQSEPFGIPAISIRQPLDWVVTAAMGAFLVVCAAAGMLPKRRSP